MPSSFRILTVDPADEPVLRRYYDTFEAAATPGRTDPTLWTYDEMKVAVGAPSSVRRMEVYLALDGDVPVAAGDLTLPLHDNTHLLEFDFAVLPEHRRRGVGSAVFAHVEARAEAEGRSSLATEVSVAAGTQDTAPARSFLTARGLTLRNTEIRRQQRLPVSPERLDQLAAKAAEKASGYRLETWSGPCPDAYAEQYAALKGLLVAEAPTGDMDIEPEKWDVARLREEEQRTRAQRRTMHTTVAVAPDGTLAGHTQIAVPGHEPGRAYQWDTLVLGSHRGHRLGLASKVANLRSLQAAHPDVTRIETWNAEQNGPMVAVNEELGYRIIEVCQEWQR